MKLILYDSINKFSDDVMDFLAEEEIQNNLLISNCLRGKSGRNTADWFMGVTRDSTGAIRLIALMTPPHNLVIYEVNNTPDNEAVELLINEIADRQIPVPGVLAERSLAARFADKYSSVSGMNKKVGKNLRIYRLDKLNCIPFAAGKLRLAKQNELYYLPYWNVGFNLDCSIQGADLRGSVDKVNRLIEDKALFIWEDKVPVSQAAMGRRTLNGAIVNAVYTPPHYRDKGYASSCVASLSKYLLEDGYKFCSLFTNLANPVSNSIYMKIGYKPVCDYDEYWFEAVSE